MHVRQEPSHPVLHALAERALFVLMEVELRVRQDAGEERALGRREVLGLEAEVEVRRLGDAVEPGAVLDDVEVELEDLRLVEGRLEPPGQEHLLDLAGEILLAVQEEVLGELHADGARPLNEAPAGEVAREGLADGPGREAAVGEEAGVLVGEHGVHEERADAVDRRPVAASGTGGHLEPGAVGLAHPV